MMAIGTVTEAGSKAVVAVRLCWVTRQNDSPRQHNPIELDDDELAAGLPVPPPDDPNLLASLEEAEVPSLWLL